MRHLLLSLLLSPVLRTSVSISTTSARRAAQTLPNLEYPICRRNFTCAAPLKQDFRTIMSDLSQEQQKEGLERLADPCEEGKILDKNEGREEALKELDEAGKKKGGEKKKQEELPKLSAADFRVYNSMAEHMEYFHDHFRQTWNMLFTACTNNKRPAYLSLKQFISAGIQFCSHLSAHHGIEEQHIFPVLATKMPEFKAGRNAAELLRQHKEIHKGMDQFEEYLQRCRSGETELEMRVLKEKMDSWGEVLWKHLDQEVKTLGAENMRKYWTLEEMRRMPM